MRLLRLRLPARREAVDGQDLARRRPRGRRADPRRTRAERVVVEGGAARGVEARTADGHPVTVRARAVVAACGAIHTPALLRRSGLENLNIGKHLRLHPATVVWGVFDEEVRPWEGTMQAIYSDQHRYLDGGYGVKYETAAIHPSLLVVFSPWRGAASTPGSWRRCPTPSRSACCCATATREVRVDRAGQPVVEYRLSDYDVRHVRRGVEGAAEILEAAGAQRDLLLALAWVAYEPGTAGASSSCVTRTRAGGTRGTALRLVPHHGQRAHGRLAGDVGLQPARRDVGGAQPLRLRRLGVPDRVGRQPDDLDRVDRAHERHRDRRHAALVASLAGVKTRALGIK